MDKINDPVACPAKVFECLKKHAKERTLCLLIEIISTFAIGIIFKKYVILVGNYIGNILIIISLILAILLISQIILHRKKVFSNLKINTSNIIDAIKKFTCGNFKKCFKII